MMSAAEPPNNINESYVHHTYTVTYTQSHTPTRSSHCFSHADYFTQYWDAICRGATKHHQWVIHHRAGRGLHDWHCGRGFEAARIHIIHISINCFNFWFQYGAFDSWRFAGMCSCKNDWLLFSLLMWLALGVWVCKYVCWCFDWNFILFIILRKGAFLCNRFFSYFLSRFLFHFISIDGFSIYFSLPQSSHLTQPAAEEDGGVFFLFHLFP